MYYSRPSNNHSNETMLTFKINKNKTISPINPAHKTPYSLSFAFTILLLIGSATLWFHKQMA
jgi:hypothetical protein